MRAARALVVVALASCANGSRWIEQPIPDPAHQYALWVGGEHDVWVGGKSVWHFDGVFWVETPPPVATHVISMWGSGPKDVWAVGMPFLTAPEEQGVYAALHWDGQAWSVVTPNNGVSFHALGQVCGTGPSDVWIAHDGALARFDGSQWTDVWVDNQRAMLGKMWASSPTDAWQSTLGPIYHFDGTTWSPIATGAWPTLAQDFWSASPDDVWAASGDDKLVHWDGTTWSDTSAMLDRHAWVSVWGASSEDVYAVEADGHVAHYDGQAWAVDPELAPGRFSQIRGSSATNIWATAVKPGANGDRAVLLKYQP